MNDLPNDCDPGHTTSSIDFSPTRALRRQSASPLQPPEVLPLYSVYRVEPKQSIGPARSIDHALILAEASGPGRYEVFVVGDALRHLCFVTKHEDGTFTIDPRQVGSLMAVLSDTLTRA
jgi:hypothetical protein